MPINRDQILDSLRQVPDPAGDGDLVRGGRVRHAACCDGLVSITLDVPGADEAVRRRLGEAAEGAIRRRDESVRRVEVTFSEPAPPAPGTAGAPPGGASAAEAELPGVRRIVAVGAGKGGVGKSTVAVNLAVGLARRGSKVGLLDGDIYGPSLPTMLGTDRLQVRAEGKRILPFEVHGIKAMTIGAMVEAEKPLIWRGPMAHGAFRQLATQTEWGELDYLIIDLPPGTGDVPLTMSQLLPLTGAVIVCTPQKVAQDDAVRALNMFRQLGVEIIGVVENMSYFVGDDGKEYDIFGRGGAQMLAGQQQVAYLGPVAIDMGLRRNTDAGEPSANFEVEGALSTDLDALVGRFVEQVEAAAAAQQPPTVEIR